MKSFVLAPQINVCDSTAEFCNEYAIGKGDLVFISQRSLDANFANKFTNATIIDYRKYGVGEPTDLMVEGIYNDIKNIEIKRVFAIGGGTILDVAKLFALKQIMPVDKLFAGEITPQKNKSLILIPTTCGTGSEVTNISILELTKNKTKLGLANNALFADEAVLIPELLHDLPFRFFATSSMDALIHAIESFTSPKATELTQMFSLNAMDKIIAGYQKIAADKTALDDKLLHDFLTASTYAGIAFGNAGCAAVHALSYPLGAAYHVPHGEANYAMFMQVYKTYELIENKPVLQALKQHLATILHCSANNVFSQLEALLQQIIPLKALHEYGVTTNDLTAFTDVVMQKQGRLMANNCCELSSANVLSIYKQLY
ncbi:4-hydroxybutyrate dehydrogenase [Pectinatus brassicae]|uniref:4-hydroxybutyrate dehydrogenase n=1 Tax=Pectinatus brassicae TaxID=862415 RepID=A0A840UI15_9FIRM|nr:4-hydroxybutyrate dehydrogenase [Pectinatus brassicae]MBB5335197.1 4-hydroxybutyrate dehydrogenase [Pectinatus brassicae]